MTTSFRLLGDVARELGVKPHRIQYAFASGLVQEPALRLGNKRILDEADVERLRAHFFRSNKEQIMNEYQSMTDIGRLYGLTNQQVGKALHAAGLRDERKKPTPKAFNEEWVHQLPSTQPGTYFWGWHVEKTCALLEASGYQRLEAELN